MNFHIKQKSIAITLLFFGVFATTAKTYRVEKEVRLNGKNELSFRFDADSRKWIEINN
jgi:hypothetical protein